MLLPFRDDKPLRHIPFQLVTVATILGCVAVFVWQMSGDPEHMRDIAFGFGMIPAVLWGSASLPPDLVRVPAEATLLTSMFLHGGIAHLCGNMLFLWIFGDNVEDAMGHLRFVLFYLLCGIAGGLCHALAAPLSTVPTVGASGAISGVLGAYLLLHPKARILTLVFAFFVRVPAWLVLGLWFAIQFFSGAADVAIAEAGSKDGGGVAWFAHIGGFLAGMVLVLLLKRRDVPLLDGALSPEFQSEVSERSGTARTRRAFEQKYGRTLPRSVSPRRRPVLDYLSDPAAEGTSHGVDREDPNAAPPLTVRVAAPARSRRSRIPQTAKPERDPRNRLARQNRNPWA